MSNPNPDSPRSFSEGGEERMELNLGWRCNHRCRFCMQAHDAEDHPTWASYEEAAAELRRFAEAHGNIRFLGLLGGEPTLYPSILPLLDTARSLGFSEITLNTNGVGFARAAFARELVEHGVRRVCLSMHSEVPAIEDYLRKIRAIRNLLALRREFSGLELSVNAVLTTKSVPTLEAFLRFFLRLGLRDIRLNFIRPEGRALDHPWLVPTFTDTIPELMRLVELNERELHLHLTFGEIPYCVYPRAFFLNPEARHRYIGEYIDRRTHVTQYLSIEGEATPVTSRFIWQEAKNETLKLLTPACPDCDWVDVCGGVWTHYLELHGTGEFSAIREAADVKP